MRHILALALFTLVFAAIPLHAAEPTPSEVSEPALDAPAEAWLGYISQKSPIPVSTNLAAWIANTIAKPILRPQDATALYLLGFHIFNADKNSALGLDILERLELVAASDPAYDQFVTVLNMTKATTAAQVLALASGNIGDQVVAHVNWQSQLLGAPSLIPDYYATVVGMGVADMGYAPWFKDHIASMTTEQKVTALEAEISALLMQPANPVRDALLVEFRGMRLVLKELEG